MAAWSEPWQTGEVMGPKKALLILKPEVAAAMVKRAKRPILVLGHLATAGDPDYVDALDYAIRLSKAAGVPVVATANTVKALVRRGFKPAAWMSAMDIGSRLQDTSWRGLDDRGPYDLALFMGLPYYMESTILAGLKNCTTLKTVSLDRYYGPNATWSFPNLSVKDWRESLEAVLSTLEAKRLENVNV